MQPLTGSGLFIIKIIKIKGWFFCYKIDPKMFWIAQMGDQSTPKIVGLKMPSSATILARQRKDLVSPLETGPVVENGLGNWRINITMRFFCMYNTTLLMHTMPTKKVWYNQKYQGRTLCNWRIWSFCSFTKRQKCSVDASDPQLSFNIQGVNKKVKNSILLVLHLKRVKMLF